MRATGRASRKKARDVARRKALEAYGGCCVCCGVADEVFLAFDHVSGGGGEHRRQESIVDMAIWLVKQGFPEGFQILCHNCNYAKHQLGRCPHEVYDSGSALR